MHHHTIRHRATTAKGSPCTTVPCRTPPRHPCRALTATATANPNLTCRQYRATTASPYPARPRPAKPYRDRQPRLSATLACCESRSDRISQCHHPATGDFLSFTTAKLAKSGQTLPHPARPYAPCHDRQPGHPGHTGRAMTAETYRGLPELPAPRRPYCTVPRPPRRTKPAPPNQTSTASPDQACPAKPDLDRLAGPSLAPPRQTRPRPPAEPSLTLPNLAVP